MAYTQTPVSSTVITKRFNFTGSNEQRDGFPNKDQRYVNFVPEKTVGLAKSDSTWWLKNRPGITPIHGIPVSGELRGAFYWNTDTPAHMSVTGNSICYNGTFLSAIATSTGQVGFTEFLDSSGNRRLILLDGTNGYIFTAYNVPPILITDVNFPTPHAPTPIFLDGYLFVAKPGGQDIYNSNLDDPTTWTPGDFISAEMYPDSIVGLSRNNNYIYAIGQSSVEFFYDAANDSGSPLARHASAVQQFGTPWLGSVVATDKEVFMVAQLQAGGLTVFSIDGFKEAEIATPSIQNALNVHRQGGGTAYGNVAQLGGQKVYILTVGSRTFVWACTDKVWFEWNFVNNPVSFMDSGTGYPYVFLSSLSSNYIGQFTPVAFKDIDDVITCTLITSKFDFDTMDRKRMDSLVLIGDSPTTGNTAVSIQWSDDDYNTWSTARTLNINPTYSNIHRLGMFRRRAFKIVYSLIAPIRWEGLEITVNRGQT